MGAWIRFLVTARLFKVRMCLSFISSIVLFSVAACTDSIAGPASPPSRLDGNWRTAPVVPSGTGIDLSLATDGLIVTGTGHQYVLQYLKDSFTITGRQSSDGTTFSLTLTSDNGSVGTHSGYMVGSSELRIEWEQPPCPGPARCGPDSLTFVRE